MHIAQFFLEYVKKLYNILHLHVKNFMILFKLEKKYMFMIDYLKKLKMYIKNKKI